jgi:hypothetical protein
MGIVKISESMHEVLRVASSALSRSINAQAEHWMRIGMLAELNPDLNHSEISRLLIRAEQSGGLDLQRLSGLEDFTKNHKAGSVEAGSNE